MLIKPRSFVSALLSSLFVTGLTTIGVVPGSFAVLSGKSHQQIFPNIQDVNTSTLSSAPPLLQKQYTQFSGMNLHLVKIISPTKDEQVPVGRDLTISGISSDNSKTSNCNVSVIVNGNKPYRTAYPAGEAGGGDYSKWNFTLTPSGTGIKEGQNKITAKFSCDNAPNLISHNSVNVTGVTSTHGSDVTQQLQHPDTGKNSVYKKLTSDNNDNNYDVERSHPLSIISIPHIHLPQIKIPFNLPFH
jgi:hypothetical protein